MLGVSVGSIVGTDAGSLEGLRVLFAFVGFDVDNDVGRLSGVFVGSSVGESEGKAVGVEEGLQVGVMEVGFVVVGDVDGSFVFATEGKRVGFEVGVTFGAFDGFIVVGE